MWDANLGRVTSDSALLVTPYVVSGLADVLQVSPFDFFFFFFFFFSFFWPPPRHIEVPTLGVVLEVVPAAPPPPPQSHSNAGSELHLQPTPQLTATLDP